MKCVKKLLFIILILVVAVVVALCVWQWDNIKSLYTATVKDSESIVQDMQQRQQEIENTLSEHHVTISTPTVEQNESLLNGTLTAEEVKDALGLTEVIEGIDSSNSSDIESQQGTSQTVSQNSQEQDQDSPSYQKLQSEQLVNQCVAELYACQVDLMAQLGAMKQQAVAQYNSLPSEQQTRAKLQEIGLNGLSQCYDMEVEADRTVKSILSRYREKLEALNADTTILDTMWKYYCDQKSSQKSYYLNKYMN